jgi:hypothetical protein
LDIIATLKFNFMAFSSQTRSNQAETPQDYTHPAFGCANLWMVALTLENITFLL